MGNAPLLKKIMSLVHQAEPGGGMFVIDRHNELVAPDVGTPQDMAPEIVRRRATDQRVDIFALGVTAYMLFAFEHPWNASELDGRAALHHDTQAPTPILQVVPKLNPAVAELIMQCIKADPNARPESADAIQQKLAKVKDEF